ncbi:DNA cytosine methyltransferase [Peribacillus sp. AS_2]|uniref:DNA cytosine methyltransferase n=1 Tax=Peribacillus sp. AS_2 TaxID=2996755 RepID=UPI0022A72E1F|nr:DNA cytosine methyltransferase [Peribacillus sp. AS_2]MCZ0870915.1 DNA cytosine methyltransferase [Peribacillus sp. AS_2]
MSTVNNKDIFSPIKDRIEKLVKTKDLENFRSNQKIAMDKENEDVRYYARLVGAWLAYSNEINNINYALDYRGSIDVIDLFSGCGGISTGFKAITSVLPSFRERGAVDIDIKANMTYEANLGIKPKHIDINELVMKNDSELNDLFDINEKNPLVLIGCAPCQGFSSHSKKLRNDNDIRNTLVGTFAKVAAKIKPDFVIMENVPELLAKKYWGNFQEFKKTMEDSGYFVRATIVNMAEYGVPQARYRALVIASKKRFFMPKGFLDRENVRTVRDAIGYLPPIEPGVANEDDSFHVTARHQKSTVDTIASVPKNGGNRPHGIGPQCLDKVKGFSDVYGRLYWDRPSITITNYARNPASGRFSHPEQDRGLSVREAALLQGFPSNFIFEGTFDEKFRQIGNAVPPRFSTYLAAHILGEMMADEPTEIEYLEDKKYDVTEPVSNSFSSVIAGLKKRRG